jgi:hypothetical protein
MGLTTHYTLPPTPLPCTQRKETIVSPLYSGVGEPVKDFFSATVPTPLTPTPLSPEYRGGEAMRGRIRRIFNDSLAEIPSQLHPIHSHQGTLVSTGENVCPTKRGGHRGSAGRADCRVVAQWQ